MCNVTPCMRVSARAARGRLLCRTERRTSCCTMSSSLGASSMAGDLYAATAAALEGEEASGARLLLAPSACPCRVLDCARADVDAVLVPSERSPSSSAGPEHVSHRPGQVNRYVCNALRNLDGKALPGGI